MSATTRSGAFVSRAPKLGFVGTFDGIRGIGVCMVLLQHAYPTAESFSSIVDVFFVISGFLITTLLFEEHTKTGGISLRNFYIRRALRLLPGLLVVLVVGFAAVAIVDPDFTRQAGLESLAALFYVHNIFYKPIFGTYQFMGQMWSLSVEEQFYFVVSVLMFVAVPKNWMKQVFVVLMGFYLFVNISRITGHMGPGQVWFHRPDACAIGMSLAIFNAWLPKDLGPRAMAWIKGTAWVSLVLLTLSLVTSSTTLIDKFGFGTEFLPGASKQLQDQFTAASTNAAKSKLAEPMLQSGLAHLTDHWYWVRWGFTLGSLSCAVLVFCVVRLRETWSMNKVLSWPFFRYLGRASYALYISHYQLYILLGAAGILQGGPKIQAVEKIIVALVVGLLIHHFIEGPALKMKNRFSFLSTSPKPAVAAE